MPAKAMYQTHYRWLSHRLHGQASLLQWSMPLVTSGRKAASSGNRLPLFWHCRVAAARKAPVYGGY